jgi:hypothetical protein
MNNTLISGNTTNNSHNPVTEISYGTPEKQVTRFLFDVDLSSLREKIASGQISPQRVTKHILHLTNTISYAPQYIGKKSYSQSIERASSFVLDFFNINQEWNEGSGYDFIYNNTLLAFPTYEASNWFEAKTTIPWDTAGAYESGVTQIIKQQSFDVGNEDINIDISDYINQRLFGTGYTGTTAYSGDSYGIGVKFPESFESLQTEYREAVAFHTKYTNTWYEPYVETIIDDTIIDDRNYFFLDKSNSLYIYPSMGGTQKNITVDYVNIYDYDDELYATISGTSVINVDRGIYKIELTINSDDYPDAVIFRDEWHLKVNNREMIYSGDFYLISADKYYTFDQSNQIDFDNYFFYYWGIGQGENIVAGNTKKIKLTLRELYPNQNNYLPLDIEYRVFTTVGSNYEITVVPFTPVNRTNDGYYFNLDTSWLIPQDYYLQIRLKNGDYYENKQTISFTIVSNGINFT